MVVARDRMRAGLSVLVLLACVLLVMPVRRLLAEGLFMDPNTAAQLWSSLQQFVLRLLLPGADVGTSPGVCAVLVYFCMFWGQCRGCVRWLLCVIGGHADWQWT